MHYGYRKESKKQNTTGWNEHFIDARSENKNLTKRLPKEIVEEYKRVVFELIIEAKIKITQNI